MRAIVVGGGISGVACARALAAAGVPVIVRDRGRRLGGRMMSRTLRGTGTVHDGRVVDIGASYFTVRDGDFAAAVGQLESAGVVRPWTTAFHVHGAEGMAGISSGPMRYSAPAGLRSVVEWLAEGLDVSLGDEVAEVAIEGVGVRVDGEPVLAAALGLPDPQAQKIAPAPPASHLTYEPIIAVTLVFERRSWLDMDGVFVNDDPVLTWIADDGRRRGDDAPVLVAHVNPVLSALHLDHPEGVLAQAVASVGRVLGMRTTPDWVDAHRWTYAKPLAARDEAFWIDDRAPVGVAGDAWAGGPRVEAAWLSGHRLGRALSERAGGVAPADE